MIEVEHHPLQFPFAHLAVADVHPRLGDQFGDVGGGLFDGLHLVVKKIHLPAALKFAQDGLGDEGVVPGGDEGLDGVALGGGRGDDAQVAHAAHGHVEGAGDGRGGEGQQVHFGAQFLQGLFLAHAETLFFVDDDQIQMGEFDVALEQAVGADDDVHLARRQFGQHPFFLFLGAKAGDGLDFERPFGEAVQEVLVMLLGQQGGGHQHGDLAAVVHGGEGGAHGHLGLAEADVAADHPVHGFAGGHVLEHLADGGGLIRGLLEGKAIGEGQVLRFVDAHGVARFGLAAGVQFQQFGGHVAQLLRCLALDLLPLLAAQFVQGRVLLRRAGIAGDQMQRGDGHVEFVAAGVFQSQEFGAHIAHVEDLQASVAAYALFLVDDRGARLQFRQVFDDGVGIALFGGTGAAAFLLHPVAEQLRFGDDRYRAVVQFQSLFQGRNGNTDRGVGFQKGPPTADLMHVDLVIHEQAAQHFPATGGFGGEQHPALPAA